MKSSDNPPWVDYCSVSPKSISPNNIQVLLWLWWLFQQGVNDWILFMIQHGRPGNGPDERRTSLGCSRTLQASHQDPRCSCGCVHLPPPPLSVTWKHTAALWSMCVLLWVSSPPVWDLPPSTITTPFPQQSGVGGGGSHQTCFLLHQVNEE